MVKGEDLKLRRFLHQIRKSGLEWLQGISFKEFLLAEDNDLLIYQLIEF